MLVNELQELAGHARASLAALPTPIHPLPRLTEHLDGPELWIKRDDLTGLAGGGNKTRKLEFFVGEALRQCADSLVTVGAIQSNHTRQTAAAAARAGLGCALLHNAWTPDAGAHYRRTGNVLLSALLGAELFADRTERPLGDAGELHLLAEELRARGRRPYVIPGGASDHRLGGLGYVACAAEITAQANALGLDFDYMVHCTGSSGTQAGLLAGFALLEQPTRVIGVSDDDEVDDKHARVRRLADATLDELGSARRIAADDIEITITDPNPYGVAGPETLDAIRLFARTEGLMADPVYEGKALRGLMDLIERGRFKRSDRVLLLHMGGTDAVHGYADQLWSGELIPFQRGTPPRPRT